MDLLKKTKKTIDSPSSGFPMEKITKKTSSANPSYSSWALLANKHKTRLQAFFRGPHLVATTIPLVFFRQVTGDFHSHGPWCRWDAQNAGGLCDGNVHREMQPEFTERCPKKIRLGGAPIDHLFFGSICEIHQQQ